MALSAAMGPSRGPPAPACPLVADRLQIKPGDLVVRREAERDFEGLRFEPRPPPVPPIVAALVAFDELEALQFTQGARSFCNAGQGREVAGRQDNEVLGGERVPGAERSASERACRSRPPGP